MGTKAHQAAMEALTTEVGAVLSLASFGGKHIQVKRGIGAEENFVFEDEEKLENFLKLNKQKKAE